MGLNINSLKFLLLAADRGVPFGHVLMVGRQSLTLSPGDIRALMRLPLTEERRAALGRLRLGSDAYAEPFFLLCGATAVDSMDMTAYEGATVLHDLNVPVPDALENRFDLIVDGGSLEHVFNISMAIRNCMQMLKVDGHYICNTATNNYSGHGFYQLSPEFFFAALAPENGFHVLEAYLYEENGGNRWYRLSLPADAVRRMTFQNRVPAHLLILAKKSADTAVFNRFPQQRMYDAAWASPGVDVIGARKGPRELAFRWWAGLPPMLKWWVLNTWNVTNRFRKDLFTRVDPETRNRT